MRSSPWPRCAGSSPSSRGRRSTSGGRRICGWQGEPREPCDAESALDALDAVLGDAIVTTDVGQHQMWAAGRLRFETPRRWITSGGLGTMGFGLPAALGAQAAAPDATVVCVSGEGSFLMNVQELATAVEEALPVKVLLLDNASLGMVRQQQDLFWDGRRTAVELGTSPTGSCWGARSAGPCARLREGDDVAGRAGGDARREWSGPAACAYRFGCELPADVPPGRGRTGDDRLSSPSPSRRRDHRRGGLTPAVRAAPR